MTPLGSSKARQAIPGQSLPYPYRLLNLFNRPYLWKLTFPQGLDYHFVTIIIGFYSAWIASSNELQQSSICCLLWAPSSGLSPSVILNNFRNTFQEWHWLCIESQNTTTGIRGKKNRRGIVVDQNRSWLLTFKQSIIRISCLVLLVRITLL